MQAGVISGAAVVLFAFVAWHLTTVPLSNEPQDLRRSIQHVALMAALVIVSFVAAIVAILRGALGGGRRGLVRAVPILLGLLGVVAAIVCALVTFASLLATRDV